MNYVFDFTSAQIDVGSSCCFVRGGLSEPENRIEEDRSKAAARSTEKPTTSATIPCRTLSTYATVLKHLVSTTLGCHTDIGDWTRIDRRSASYGVLPATAFCQLRCSISCWLRLASEAINSPAFVVWPRSVPTRNAFGCRDRSKIQQFAEQLRVLPP